MMAGRPVDDDLRVKGAREVVKSIVDLLQERFYEYTRKNLAEVVTSGSLGQGTTVPGNFDVDLILLSKDITPELMADTDRDAQKLVDALKKLIVNSLAGLSQRHVATTVSRGFLLLQFVVEKPGKPKIDVDLVMGPHWGDIHEANGKILIFKRQHLQEWQEYRKLLLPSIGKWQMEFIVGQPDRVKELIRRVKKWQKQQWANTNGRPSSYLLAILTVAACREWCEKNHIQCDHLHLDAMPKPSFYAFQSGVQKIFEGFVINHHLLRLLLQPPHGWFGISDSPSASGDLKARYPLCDTDEPYILDPACVYHNLYKASIKPCWGGSYEHNHDWGLFARKIKGGTLDLTKSL